MTVSVARGHAANPGTLRVASRTESVVSKSDVSSLECPNCKAKYKVVRVEADPKSVDCQIACRNCGAPSHGREGSIAWKYFMVERPKVRAIARRFG